MANILLPFGGAGPAFQIAKSVRLRRSSGAFFSQTPGAVRNRRTYTISTWVKAPDTSGANGIFSVLFPAVQFVVYFDGGLLKVWEYLSASYWFQLVSNVCVRDPSGWFHVCVAIDTTQATAADRVKIWLNGRQVAGFSTAIYPSLNYDTLVGSTNTHYWGAGSPGPTAFLDGNLAESCLVFGQALPASAFGKFDPVTGQWVPVAYAGVFGAGGSRLDFADATSAAALGHDRSGGANNWSASGVSVTAGASFDQSADTPTNNHAIVFPIDGPATNGTRSFADAGSKIAGIASAANQAVGFASLWVPPDFGGFYFEAMPQNLDVNTSSYVGIGGPGRFYAPNGQYWDGSSWTAYGATYASGDVIGVAVNMTAGELEFFKNGVSQGKKTGIAYSPVAVFPYFSAHSSGATPAWTLNFGQRPFAYAPPAGTKALNVRNLALPAIKRASDGMRVLLDTGANIKAACDAAYPAADFLALIKDRANANNWQAIDTVRGTSAVLQPNTTATETTYGAPSGSSAGFVWNRGAAYGFDIVTYTGNAVAGTTIAHALGAVPHLAIVKSRSLATNWYVYHRNLSSAAYQLFLNLANAQDNVVTTAFNGKAPTASAFELPGAGLGSNNNGATYVAYLWTEIPGFSRIGAFTGNGTTDGPFVWCGFKPRLVLAKRIDSAASWAMLDSARSTFNVTDAYLFPDLSNAESSPNGNPFDLLSNGFKVRTSAGMNASGGTYVFAAFAEAPFKYANAR